MLAMQLSNILQGCKNAGTCSGCFVCSLWMTLWLRNWSGTLTFFQGHCSSDQIALAVRKYAVDYLNSLDLPSVQAACDKSVRFPPSSPQDAGPVQHRGRTPHASYGITLASIVSIQLDHDGQRTAWLEKRWLCGRTHTRSCEGC